MTTEDTVLPGMPGEASRRASGLAVAFLCLLLAARVSYVLAFGTAGQLPFTVALFVLPFAYTVPVTRPVLERYRWPVLAAQALLTWVPVALFGGAWQPGIDGLLAGLVLLAADVTIRATVIGIGLPPVATWYRVVTVVTFYVNDALEFFAMVRLAQIVGEVEHARHQAADLAATDERLRAAGELQAVVGQRLADIAARSAAARHALSSNAAAARGQISAAGEAAREAVAQARAVAAHRIPPRAGPTAAPAQAVIGARLAWAVLVTVLVMFAVEDVANVIGSHHSAPVATLATGSIILIIVLQLHHSRPGRGRRRPVAWPVTLAVQGALVYAFSFPFAGFSGGTMAPFLAGSVLQLVPGWRRWAGYAAVVVGSSVLYATLWLDALGLPAARRPLYALSFASVAATVGLVMYGLSRLVSQAAELEVLGEGLARMAAVRERLRIARDVHDLLGLGLSAAALKTDLITKLIGRDDARAAAEIGELTRICAVARAEARLITTDGQRLSLARELTAVTQILATAGIEVRASIADGPLPSAADEAMAPVLREAVTNILRHSAAMTCVIEMTTDRGLLRLRVGNDGVTGQPRTGSDGGPPATGGAACRGLANLTARMAAAGGRLTRNQADGRFDLTAEIPLPRAAARS